MTVQQLIDALSRYHPDTLVKIRMGSGDGFAGTVTAELGTVGWDGGWDEGESTGDDPEPEPTDAREPAVLLMPM